MHFILPVLYVDEAVDFEGEGRRWVGSAGCCSGGDCGKRRILGGKVVVGVGAGVGVDASLFLLGLLLQEGAGHLILVGATDVAVAVAVNVTVSLWLLTPVPEHGANQGTYLVTPVLFTGVTSFHVHIPASSTG